jgi:molybdopterin converting factor small subunit
MKTGTSSTGAVETESIVVEFYGIPRLRAGIERVELTAPAEGLLLGEVLSRLAERFPIFGSECVNEHALAKSITANINGTNFTRDVKQRILPGQVIILLSADAGG